MGKKWQKNGVVASRTKAADETWSREADFNGTKEVHFKFFVHDEPGAVPSGCPFVPLDWREADKRALQHEMARGDQFVKNCSRVTPSGVGRRLVQEGFTFCRFSHHMKDTLHQKERRAVVECVFSKKPAECLEWKDTMLGWYLSVAWTVHCYKNPGIMTLNFAHPQRGRHIENVFQIGSGRISVIPVAR